ncbi:MAG: molybdenum cofactor guanylyltransferase [candidate division KSB1 bacterium]|nr:molybdenum cofactor guanylyltransferase [candidate division KSB1 bacterium]
MHTLSAAILAGGRSSRMGRNKALLQLNGRTLIEHVVQAASSVTDSVFLVTNQLDDFAFLKLPMYPDLIPNLGPIGGILTALHHSQTRHCLILACDLPFVTPDALAALVRRTRARERAVVLNVGRGPEPLCGIYPATALAEVQARIDSRELKLQTLLDHLDVDVIDWHQDRDRVLFNINTPDDFKVAEALMCKQPPASGGRPHSP